MKIGPISIMSSKKEQAYKNLHFEAGILHMRLWFSDDWTKDRESIMKDVIELGVALSHLPDFYFD